MPLASFTQRREKFRALLNRPRMISPGSVFDPIAARLATKAGYEVGLFAGSVASHVIMGAPDIVVLTLPELVEQTRRITRAAEIPLIVDADHGYGNALNVMRTIEELEQAGAAALTIEDSVLPRRHGGAGGPGGEIIPREEYGDKLRAAITARTDPALTIIGRTEGVPRGIEETVARVQLAREAGVDAIFARGMTDVAQLDAVREAAGGLPLVVNTAVGSADEMASKGVRLFFAGHLPYFVMLRALYDAYERVLAGAPSSELAAKSLTSELQAVALDEAQYTRWAKEFLAAP